MDRLVYEVLPLALILFVGAVLTSPFDATSVGAYGAWVSATVAVSIICIVLASFSVAHRSNWRHPRLLSIGLIVWGLVIYGLSTSIALRW